MKASKQELFFANTNTNSHSIPARCLLLKFLDVLILKVISLACLTTAGTFLWSLGSKWLEVHWTFCSPSEKRLGKRKSRKNLVFKVFFFFYHIRQLWISSHKNNQSKTLLYSTVIIIMRSKKYIFLLIGSFDFLRYKSLSHRVGRGGEGRGQLSSIEYKGVL